jgi:hypothetical protein
MYCMDNARIKSLLLIVKCCISYIVIYYKIKVYDIVWLLYLFYYYYLISIAIFLSNSFLFDFLILKAEIIAAPHNATLAIAKI